MKKHDNVYAPPNSDDADTASEDSEDMLIDASAGVRFGNFAIDSICRLALSFGLGVVFGVLGISLQGTVESLLFSFAIFVGYYVVLEGVFGVTVGKLITGTRVVDKSGNKPSFGAVLGRTLVRLVPFEPFSFLGSSAGGWHDQWSSTRVVVKLRR